jgi:hypothetical protein
MKNIRKVKILTAILFASTCIARQNASAQALKTPQDKVSYLTRRIAELKLTTPNPDVDAKIFEEKVNGAFKLNREAAGINWYFANIGLKAYIEDDANVVGNAANYLEAYLANATEPGGAIRDYEDVTWSIKTKLADSDDAYAGTLLSLAVQYTANGNGRLWMPSQVPVLKKIAKANILDAINPEYNLTNTFNSAPGRTETLPEDKQAYQSIMQFMDNCEAAKGLKDFAWYLRAVNDPEKDLYTEAAKKLEDGIKRQFNPEIQAFEWRADTKTDGYKYHADRFYPGRLCQVFPQAYKLDLGPDTQKMYDAAWKHLNARGDTWWAGFKYADGHIHDNSVRMHETVALNFPHMMLGYVAALRGDYEKAEAQLTNYLALLPNVHGIESNLGNIDELGWALKTARLLARKDQKPDVKDATPGF